MDEQLFLLFPELNEFKDLDLKAKTMEVWKRAMVEGGWEVADLLAMPFTLLIDQTPINIIDHTRAVTRTALEIARAMKGVYGDRININQDILLAGALLHDVGKLFEFEKSGGKFKKSRSGNLLRHPFSGAVFAARFGLPEEVLHIIACHSKEGDGRRATVEAIIINHADFVNFEPFK
jgi:putative nucleotidyltransferase with HDIG domain